VGCLRRRSSTGADQAKGVPACFASVRAAAKQRRLRAKGGVSAFTPTSGQSACQTLDVPGGLRRRHVYDGLDLGWVGLDAAV
jgi:hypothetical protein